MNIFLEELAKQYPDDMILLCCDGTAWHKAGSLHIPENIRLFFIPPYTPEMDPIEQIWKGLRKLGFHNKVFTTLEKMGAMILTEASDSSRFDSPDKLLAYAGMSPSTYQSGQIKNCYPHMEKRGSRYLRYALFNATKYVCHWDPCFAAYLAKKRAKDKHYNVAISHAAKKLVRLIFALEKSGRSYCPIV